MQLVSYQKLIPQVSPSYHRDPCQDPEERDCCRQGLFHRRKHHRGRDSHRAWGCTQVLLPFTSQLKRSQSIFHQFWVTFESNYLVTCLCVWTGVRLTSREVYSRIAPGSVRVWILNYWGNIWQVWLISKYKDKLTCA